MINVVPVVLCGGSGTRLWPLSRSSFPKQFLALTGTQTLFQQTILRSVGASDEEVTAGSPLIVTNEAHRFLVLEQLREIEHQVQSIILEPSSKNTAPALTLAACQAVENGDDPVLIVMPSDHAIADVDAFQETLRKAAQVADLGGIVTMGISATTPETGYGYLRYGDEEGEHGERELEGFIEKPDLASAKEYIASGKYAWNGGIFVLKASLWLSAVQALQPSMGKAILASWEQRTEDGNFTRPHEESFGLVDADSIDYAVMERCKDAGIGISMVPLNAGWSDLGAWDAVWQVNEKDNHQNHIEGDVLVHNTRGCEIQAQSRLVATSGIEDLVIVETPDAVMVGEKNSAQSVKSIVARLASKKRKEHLSHRKVSRPWGWYDSIDSGERFQVKRICVNAGASLSLQKHHHRAEHWIVVKGTAEVTCGEKVFLLSENESTYIPIGEIHRLKNPGQLPLEMIEVQSGSYLGEDDIVRYEDDYGRTEK